jgi:hypothetical protein
MHVDAEGTQATSAGNGADTDRDVASRMRAQALEMERHRTPCEAGVGAGVRAGVVACVSRGTGVQTLAPVWMSGL